MLQVNNLKKSYGEVNALNGLNMRVESGEIYGLIGPTGSGKTTFMRICMGLMRADSGTVRLFGYNTQQNAKYVHGTVGYMPDCFGVYETLKVIEYLEFYAELYGISGQFRSYWMELLSLVSLEDKADCYVDSLSHEMKQRLGIARSLVHNPVLLLLDEPSTGLDSMGKLQILQVLRNLKQCGKTVIITSNILTDLENVCTQIGIIKEGIMIVEGTMNEVLDKVNDSSPIMITVLGDVSRALRILKLNSHVTRVSIEQNTIYAGFKGVEEEEAQLLQELVFANVKVSDFKRLKGGLENLFFEITNDLDGKKEKYENQSSLLKGFKAKRKKL